MRVGREQAGLGGHSFDSSRERREAFRRSHRPGDIVRARFQEWELRPATADASGLAWVQVDGHALRAPLCGEFAPGDRFLLQVNALEPEIVLAMVARGDAAATADEAARPRLHITI